MHRLADDPPARETATLETMLGCVRSGLGATLPPVSSLPEGDGELRVLPVPEAYRHMTTRLIRRRDRFVSKVFAAFAERLRAHRFGGRDVRLPRHPTAGYHLACCLPVLVLYPFVLLYRPAVRSHLCCRPSRPTGLRRP